MPDRYLADRLHLGDLRESWAWLQTVDLGRSLRKGVDVKDND
jgi:hypothetical protein